MTSKKLPLILAFCALAPAAIACAPLAQYGAISAGQPGATAPSTGGLPASSPATNAPLANAGATESESPAAAAAPSSVSVSIRNSCGRTVKVFYGSKPKFGSGTYSSASDNSVSNHSFRPGDQFWIVDDSQNGVANVVVDQNTREIEITGACDRLAAR